MSKGYLVQDVVRGQQHIVGELISLAREAPAEDFEGKAAEPAARHQHFDARSLGLIRVVFLEGGQAGAEGIVSLLSPLCCPFPYDLLQRGPNP